MNIISEKRLNEITSSFEKMKPILVVGDIGVDKYTQGEVKRISPEAPVPVIEVTKEWEKLGLAANISDNLKSLNIKSTLCGVSGNDLNAGRLDNLLEENGLKTWGIVRDENRPTVFKERVTTDTQQVCRIDYERTEYISPEVSKRLSDRVIDFKNDHSALIIEDYCKGTLTEDLIQNLIKDFKSSGRLITVDPGRKTPPSFYRGATLLKPNQLEATMMVESLGYTYEKKSLAEMAEILVDKLELEKLVITLGKEGMALFDKTNNSGLEIIPTVATEVYDVSGAGDTAISLLTASLEAGATLSEAAWISNCGSGVVVAKHGTATVNLGELRLFHRKLLENYEFSR